MVPSITSDSLGNCARERFSLSEKSLSFTSRLSTSTSTIRPISAHRPAKMPKKLGALLEAEKALKAISDKIGENISDTTIAAKEKGSEIATENKPKIDELKAEYEKKKQEFSSAFEKRNFVHRRIVKAFPNLKNGRYSAVYERAVALKKKASNWKK